MADEYEKEKRIRERAYYIWLAEGQPEGRADQHWEQAKLQIEREGESEPTLPVPGPYEDLH